MIMEYLENIVQLLCILLAMLISLFRYISTKKREWMYSVAFFTSSLLSSYFWSAYLVIMGDTPDASDLLTYFGWNVSYFVLAILVFRIKSREERRYFHPVMLLPVPLNIWQLHLYLQFGGILNSIYQVTVCTVISCLCLQSIAWHRRHRTDPSVRRPYIEAAVLACIVSEFGMWTSSCFEGWTEYVYYLFSFLCSSSYFIILIAINRTHAGSIKEAKGLIDSRIQRFLQFSYIVLVAVCSLGGILLGRWIRGILIRSVSPDSETDVYSIISVILFLTSIVLAAFALALILIVYFEQKISENNTLREEKLVAERSNDAKSEFLANMSHEIRTPLNAVLGMNKMIVLESRRSRDDPPKDRESARQIFSDITEYAGNIESAGNNLLSLINDILDFSKIEAGKLDITEHGYMLSSVLNDVSNMVMFRARDKGLAFYAEIDEHVPDNLYGDDMRIRQVICNILNNAVKYTDSGSVTLSLHGEGGSREGETAELVINVKDTGIGIKKEDIGKIFEKFERTDLEHNSTVEGTGLGLAITLRLLEMMNGNIHVESEYGVGSVFTIRLPQRIISAEPIGDFRRKFEKSISAMHDSEHLFRAPEARILIVDDTRMNLAVAAGLLKDTGIQIDTAESGAKAVALCAENSYDLIMLDQRMPVMDGTETLKRLRSEDNRVDMQTPVICLTADALTGAKEHYIAEGFIDYLSKPIDSRIMKQMLMEYLPPEKVITVSDEQQMSAAETELPAEEDDMYAALRRAGIDTVTGLGYCEDDDDLYNIVLDEFVQGAAEKSSGLQKFYNEHDAENYRILVHSLKSSSKTVGAEELSAAAAELEKAAAGKLWDIIEERHAGMIEAYESLVSAVADAADISI